MAGPIDTNYGSDQHGLIWGYRFSPGRPVEAITADTYVAAMAAQIPNSADFFWLHLSLANTSSENWLRQNVKLPPAFFSSLRSEETSTRLESDDDMLVAVIHDVLFESSYETSAVGSTCVCIGPQLLLSARLRPLRSVDKLREAVRAGHVFNSPVDLLAHLLREQANVLSDILRRSTTRVDQIEDRFLANRSSTTRAELGALRRSLVRLQRLLAPEPAAFFRLLNRPLDWISTDDLQELQQAAEEFSAALTDSISLVERVKLIQEELAALNNEQTGRTLFVLTVVTVLALPINLIAGLFGMNVGGIPLSTSDHGFVVIIVGLIILTAVLGWLALGRKRD
ncbi:MAG: transporter [Pseudomonadota bacterium]